MSRFLPSLIAAVASLSCLVLAGVGIVYFAPLSNESFLVPGEHRIRLPNQGTYHIGRNRYTDFNGRHYEAVSDLPESLAVTVTHRGSSVEVTPYHETPWQDVRSPVVDFKAPTAGDYTIQVSGIAEEQVFYIEPGLDWRTDWIGVLRWMLSFVAGLCGSIFFGVAFLILLILALTGVFPKRPVPLPADMPPLPLSPPPG